MQARSLVFALFLAALATPSVMAHVVAPAAQAQVFVAPPVVDPSAIIAQSQAYTDAQVSAATPPDCAVPAADTLNGTVGAARCTPHITDTRPTAVQATNTTLNADCTWSATMSRAFLSSVPIIHAEAVIPAGSTQPTSCQPITRSTTIQTGKCFQSQTTSLATVTVVGVSVAVGGQVLNPTASTCTAGMPIMVWGREPTQ